MAQDPEVLRDRGRSLEDEFFRREDARLKAKLRETADREGARQALAQASGIKSPEIVDRLLALDVRPETVTALSLVPLVEVAWADGSLDDNERRLILERAGAGGVTAGSTAHTLLEEWLTRKPDAKLLTAWTHLVQGLCQQLSRDEAAALKKDLLERARSVAGSTGGFLGMGSKVSAAEAEMIKRLDSAFPAG